MNETKQSSLVSWSALLLFSIGTLGTVLMFMAMKETVPLEQKGLSGTMALHWKNWFGIFPALFLNAAFLFLGARLFIKGSTTTLFRNLAACTALAVALSIFFGALSIGAGGRIGASTGEVLATKTHATLGALLGLASMFAAVWFGWLRGQAVGVGRPASDAPTARLASAPAVAPAKPVAKPAAPRIAVVPPSPADEGVTAAESAALFPLDEPAIESVSAPIPISPASEAPIAPALIPRSPYPEDVRRKGLIPPGAKPLETASASIAEAPAAPSVYRWTAPGSAKDAEIEHEARTSAAANEVREMPVLERSPKSFDAIEDVELAGIEALSTQESTTEETDAELDVELTAEIVEQEPAGAVVVPSPSWEQPVLFRPEEGDEEPVDAYGTPRTLVEKLRQARRAGGLERDDHEALDTGMAEEQDGETLHRIEEEPALAVSKAQLDELQEFEENAEDATEIDAEIDEEIDETDDAVEADETDEDELYEEGFRPIPRAAKVPRELDEEDGEEEDDILAEDLGDEDVEADEEIAETVPTGERDFELTAPRAAQSATLEPLDPPAIEVAAARAEPVQAGLFDAPAATAPKARPVAKTAVSKEPVEKEVVLQPVAAAPAERIVKSSPATMPRPKLLSEVGCLFIERGRVAVSMLQRQYEMDFDEACKVLDELQEMGLIGPYLGGQRRDILLTREQWLERVEKAGAAR